MIPNLGNTYHVARKKIAKADPETGLPVKPETNNGVKLEMFIFDIFPLSERMTTLEVSRAENFAPVKNADKSGAFDLPPLIPSLPPSLPP